MLWMLLRGDNIPHCGYFFFFPILVGKEEGGGTCCFSWEQNATDWQHHQCYSVHQGLQPPLEFE